MNNVVPQILSKPPCSSGLFHVHFEDTPSIILKRNDNSIFCCIYWGLKGLFRKDIPETKKFGRYLCDTVSDLMNNKGFFTSDELPAYGISKKDVKTIFDCTGADPASDLVVILAYNITVAKATKKLIDKLLLGIHCHFQQKTDNSFFLKKSHNNRVNKSKFIKEMNIL